MKIILLLLIMFISNLVSVAQASNLLEKCYKLTIRNTDNASMRAVVTINKPCQSQFVTSFLAPVTVEKGRFSNHEEFFVAAHSPITMRVLYNGKATNFWYNGEKVTVHTVKKPKHDEQFKCISKLALNQHGEVVRPSRYDFFCSLSNQ